ncbi:MAG: hypothetical protein DWQ49_08875 [Bacteroidetes bacterium]|nr:MAG: hypothetical protein DWQ49_08875 [Bacteroidota bacterium]
MSTLSTYKTLLTRKLATSSNNYYSAEARTQAINDAIRQFTDEYRPVELRKKADIAIAKDADDYYIGALPSDLSTTNRIVKLWEEANKRELVYVDPNQFYHMSGDVYTYDYAASASALRLFIAPTDITTLEAHYIADPTTLTADSDDSGLTQKSDELIALYAAEKLFQEGKDANGMALVESMKAKAVRAWHNQYGVTSKRLKSRFERVSFHNRT